MTGHINELIENRFVVDADTLRELDSLIRLHRDDIDPNAAVRYSILRADSYRYDTEDVEDVLRERNGSKTRIVSIKLTARESRVFNLDVDLAAKIRLRGNCAERAKLLALVADIRGLMIDRIIRGRRWGKKAIVQALAAVFLLVGYFGFQEIQTSYTNQINAQNVAAYYEATAVYARQLSSADTSERALLSQLAQAESTAARGDVSGEINFLVRQQIEQLRQEVVGQEESKAANSSKDISAPLWATSWWILAAVACSFGLIGAGIASVFIPSDGIIFMIGDEIRRQQRRNKIRERIVWGIAVAFIVGIASGIVAPLVS